MRKMKQQVLIVLIMCTVISGTISAATNYVVTPGTPGVTPTANYTSWGTAATNIQDAIDVVGSGGLVLVTNGTYYLTTEIMITEPITLRSFNNGTVDRDGTIIDGGYPARSNRCIYVNNVAATINGFTIMNGYTNTGGGVYLNTDGTLTNCLVRGNRARKGGGVYLNGPQPTIGNAALLDCTVSCTTTTPVATTTAARAQPGRSLAQCRCRAVLSTPGTSRIIHSSRMRLLVTIVSDTVRRVSTRGLISYG